MWRIATPMFIIAETPIHPGSGSNLSIVDLPIQRERHTSFPKIEGSSLKGCIRETFEHLIGRKNEVTKEAIDIVFGPEKGDQFAGAVAFTDAKILLFPVKSLKGIFAWVTCPFVLERFREDLSICGSNPLQELDKIDFSQLGKTICKQSNIVISSKIVLEEYTYEVGESEETAKIAEVLSNAIFPQDGVYEFWREKLKRDLVILPDDDFREFTVNSTEVITRTRIDSTTGTVQRGALWTEEYIPQDTIFYSIVTVSDIHSDNKGPFVSDSNKSEAEKVMEFLTTGLSNTVIQIGGNQTIGKGIIRVKI